VQDGIFGSKYADYYDALYSDKDYAKEASYVDKVIRTYAPEAKRLLELGCGTGLHAAYLSKRGYDITMVDRSPAMLEIAKRRTKLPQSRVVSADITSLPSFKEPFDCCISLFHVVNYLHTRAELERLFVRVHNVVRENGILMLDSWNGLAVVSQRPTVRVKDVQNGKLRLLRIVEPELDVVNSVCKNRYHLMVWKEGRMVDESREVHTIRYYFPKELQEALEEANFEVLNISSGFGNSLDEKSWNMTFVAKAR
jgi:SAM-dependent methyltransferase